MGHGLRFVHSQMSSAPQPQLSSSAYAEGGNKYILVAADYLTKWPEAWAIPDQEAKTIALKLEELISRHGVPQILLTDQGKNFESKPIAELCDLLQIDKRRTTAYHPQCDGQVERFNITLTMMLSMYVEKNQKEWDHWLPQVLLAYRSSVHESTGATPFALLYGHEARLPVDLCFPCPAEPTAPTNYQEYTATLQTKLHGLFCKQGRSFNCHREDKLTSTTAKPGENRSMLAIRFGYLILEHPGASRPN